MRLKKRKRRKRWDKHIWNTTVRCWFIFDTTLEIKTTIVGTLQRKGWPWLWTSGIGSPNLLSRLMLKWDGFVVKMSKLNPYLQQQLKEIYCQHLAGKMSECVKCFCYGCLHAKESGSVMHNLCSLHALDQVRFCIYFALNFVDGAAIMEQYGNEVCLVALEWVDIFDLEYRRSTWIAEEQWFTDVTSLVFDKWSGNSNFLLLPNDVWID